MEWKYVKFEDNKVVELPTNDLDGKITGKCILNVKYWFDENPEERIRLGWIKLLDDRKSLKYDKQTQLVSNRIEKVDEHTAKVVYTVIDKSEEMMFFDELIELSGFMNFGNFILTDI